MSATSHVAFFGDAEHTFDFSTPLLIELETLTGAGIGGLFNRLVKREFRFSDLLAVIRLGLIGGGLRPEEAGRLVKIYAEGRPIEETFPLALEILSTLWFGKPATTETPIEPAPAPAPQSREPATSNTAETAIQEGIGSEV